MQQLSAENTPAKWESVIADLTAKVNTYDTEVMELARQRDALSLDAELGQDGAAKSGLSQNDASILVFEPRPIRIPRRVFIRDTCLGCGDLSR